MPVCEAKGNMQFKAVINRVVVDPTTVEDL